MEGRRNPGTVPVLLLLGSWGLNELLDMRKILWGLLAVVVLLVVVAVAAPFVFKDKLRALADRQIAQRVRARVQYDPASLDVSVLR